jgi:hypothetical protein
MSRHPQTKALNFGRYHISLPLARQNLHLLVQGCQIACNFRAALLLVKAIFGWKTEGSFISFACLQPDPREPGRIDAMTSECKLQGSACDQEDDSWNIKECSPTGRTTRVARQPVPQREGER